NHAREIALTRDEPRRDAGLSCWLWYISPLSPILGWTRNKGGKRVFELLCQEISNSLFFNDIAGIVAKSLILKDRLPGGPTSTGENPHVESIAKPTRPAEPASRNLLENSSAATLPFPISARSASSAVKMSPCVK